MASHSNQSTMRRRILFAVGAVILISMLSSVFSLLRITEVNSSFNSISRIAAPLERLTVQMQSDSDLLKRELERSLGYSNWKDPHWKPRPLPKWILEVLDRQIERAQDLVRGELKEEGEKWAKWSERILQGWGSLKREADRLHEALLKGDRESAQQIYPAWVLAADVWQQELDWGVKESDRLLRTQFSSVQQSVTDLRTSLQIILTVVLSLSLLLLWFGEKALRPISELTRLARAIRERGLRKDDAGQFPELSPSRSDEVSQLAREFRQMAVALLEREKTVDAQKGRLESQNRLLREIGELNKNILNSIESVLIVTDLEGRITQCNPEALLWLGLGETEVMGRRLFEMKPVSDLLGFDWINWKERLNEKREWIRVEPRTVGSQVFGGRLMPLRHDSAEMAGCILVIDDVTDQEELEKRLRLAENLAAVGRMSAQVAHEIRNPLHSIGLETEIAIDVSNPLSNPTLKESLLSIQAGVERLERITENYLKLSRLSGGKRERFRVDEVLEEVLATYAPVCQASGIQVEWSREKAARFEILGDRGLLEQALGNLLKNAIQALEGRAQPKIHWNLGNTETGKVWLRIRDNGPGVPIDLQEKLFSPFLTTKAQGTGLGLAFVKQVFENHSGEISYVRTEGGACFEVLLPLDPGASATDWEREIDSNHG